MTIPLKLENDSWKWLVLKTLQLSRSFTVAAKGPSIKYVHKLSEKLTFLPPWYAHVRVRNVSFSENFAFVLNGWPPIPPISIFGTRRKVFASTVQVSASSVCFNHISVCFTFLTFLLQHSRFSKCYFPFHNAKTYHGRCCVDDGFPFDPQISLLTVHNKLWCFCTSCWRVDINFQEACMRSKHVIPKS